MSRPKGFASLVPVVLCAVTLAACGSSAVRPRHRQERVGGATSSGPRGSSGSSGVAEAKKLVASEEQPPAFTGPTSKVDIAKAKGKTVYYVSLTEEIPALHEWGVVLAQQLQAAGVTTQKCDAKGSPDGITTCLTQALAAKPAMIVAQALDTKFIASYIARAKAEGIKFVTAQTGVARDPDAQRRRRRGDV